MNIKDFQKHLESFRQGILSSEQFAPIRTLHGIYSLRNSKDRYMIRIKIPAGILASKKIQGIARLIDRFASFKHAHITTRQDIEIYGIHGDDLITVLLELAHSGLTSFTTGGNSVRNVTCCPLAGVAADEIFDVTPYAFAVNEYFQENPDYQHLPRKVKIAFEGCPTDHMKVGVQDIGVQASREKRGRRLFRIYVGGGLGAKPAIGHLLEEETELQSLLETIVAVVKIFDRLGDRKNRSRARLKFLISDLGIERFRSLVLEERTKHRLRSLSPSEHWHEIPSVAQTQKQTPKTIDREKFNRWVSANVYFQKQPGYVTVFVRCPFGDLSLAQLEKLAAASQQFSGGHVRTAITQNLVFRWVHEKDLTELYRTLDPLGLATCGAEQVMDITRCASADTCVSAITSCRGLASALEELFVNGFSEIKELRSSQIKISGCPNACGQHSIATLGFHGLAKKLGNYTIPCYRMFVGGKAAGGKTQLGEEVGVLPARRVPETVRSLFESFLKERSSREFFDGFISRLGREEIQGRVKVHEEFDLSAVQSENLFKDLGSELAFSVQAKRGECSI